MNGEIVCMHTIDNEIRVGTHCTLDHLAMIDIKSSEMSLSNCTQFLEMRESLAGISIRYRREPCLLRMHKVRDTFFSVLGSFQLDARLPVSICSALVHIVH